LIAIVVAGATVSISHETDVAELVPFDPTASTENVFVPATRGGVEYVFGLTHAAYAEPSIEHTYVTPACVSVNPKVTEVMFVGFAGPEPIDGAGGGFVFPSAITAGIAPNAIPTSAPSTPSSTRTRLGLELHAVL
jgi:hypothetical protein